MEIVHKQRKRKRKRTYQHTIIAMFVQESHTRFERDRDLLLGGAAVIGEEDGLAADAALGGGC